MRLRLPLQLKVCALIFLLFALLMHINRIQINQIISQQILEEEKEEYLKMEDIQMSFIFKINKDFKLINNVFLFFIT